MIGHTCSDRLRIGIIGAGRIVERAHLPVLSSMPEIKLAGLFDQDLGRAERLASRFAPAKVCRSLDELFDLDLDVTLIACPNRLHAPMSIAALRAGSHVLCEKPIATSVSEAEAMIQTAEAQNLELMIGSTNRFRPEVCALQKAILEGRLGEIKSIRCGWLRQKGIPGIGSWFTRRSDAGGGVLTDLGSHLLDLAIWLSGRRQLIAAHCVVDRRMDPVEQASWYQPSEQAAGGYLDVEVSASGFAVYEGPFNLFIEVSWASAVPHDHTYLQVNGSQGMARLETLFGLSPNGNRPRRPLQLYTGGLAKPEAVRGATDVLQPYRDEWRFFIKSIKSGQSLRASLYEGLAMMQLIEALYRSAEDVESGAILSPQGSIIS